MADGVLAEADWAPRERTYRGRVEQFLEPHLRRAQAGEAHPVWDFLFRYYSLRPRQLRVWHPGFGVVLGGPDSTAARRYLGRTGYGPRPAGVTVTDEHLRFRAETVGFIAELLRATASHPPRVNCFGMHEWAMVYRAPAVRHDRVPLRLGAAATDAVVESMPLRCSHFDAFRFFTEPAAQRNAGTPARSDQSDWEQPGCLHANMDLYKWCYKLGPLIESELLMDCLELAADARALDMRASPYDLVDYGFEPIAVETSAGPSRLRPRAAGHRRAGRATAGLGRRPMRRIVGGSRRGRRRLALLPAGKLDRRQMRQAAPGSRGRKI